MGGEPGDDWNAEPVQIIGELAQIGTMPGSTRINPPSPRIAMVLFQTHALAAADAVGHLIQHPFTLSVISARRYQAGQEMVGLEKITLLRRVKTWRCRSPPSLTASWPRSHGASLAGSTAPTSRATRGSPAPWTRSHRQASSSSACKLYARQGFDQRGPSSKPKR